MIKQIVFLAGMLSLGCHHATEASDSGCHGQRFAVVSNNSSEPLEVFARIGTSPSQVFLGTLSAGRREQFRLPQGSQYARVQRVGAMADRQAPVDMFDVRYLCN